MISEEQYNDAVEKTHKAQEIINQYFVEKRKRFEDRMKINLSFNDDELVYSASSRCPCGHGLAYPKDCTPDHYWDCSAILKGIANKNVQHTAKLPFTFYDIKGESEERGTTRLEV